MTEKIHTNLNEAFAFFFLSFQVLLYSMGQKMHRYVFLIPRSLTYQTMHISSHTNIDKSVFSLRLKIGYNAISYLLYIPNYSLELQSENNNYTVK